MPPPREYPIMLKALSPVQASFEEARAEASRTIEIFEQVEAPKWIQSNCRKLLQKTKKALGLWSPWMLPKLVHILFTWNIIILIGVIYHNINSKIKSEKYKFMAIKS